MKITLRSKSRWNAGIAHKRIHGSSTITEFWVLVDGWQMPWTVEGVGKTPGDRKTYAHGLAKARLERESGSLSG